MISPKLKENKSYGLWVNSLSLYSSDSIVKLSKIIEYKWIDSKHYLSILGAPGSGRSTLCQRLKQHFKFTHLSSGQIMKQEILSGSYRSDTLYEMILNGEAVPDEIVNDLIGESMMWTAEGSDVRILF